MGKAVRLGGFFFYHEIFIDFPDFPDFRTFRLSDFSDFSDFRTFQLSIHKPLALYTHFFGMLIEINFLDL